MTFYAHSLENQPTENWETMQQHEELVAEYCSKFLERIDPNLGAWGELLGRWHDIGKYSSAFQDYLKKSCNADAASEGAGKRVDHSTAGAQHASATLPNGVARLFAYSIAGHHAGLADAHSMTGNAASGLEERLKKTIENFADNTPAELLVPPPLPFPELKFSRDAKVAGFQTSVFCRFLFSALCDADFLATEEFMSPERSKVRPVAEKNVIPEMALQLDAFIDGLEKRSSEVNDRRAEVLEAARLAAAESPGLYSFTVPTGGGKTLASLSFALRHAGKNKLKRVIYAIPFTSIIEQTADVFRSVFSEHPNRVLEHHCNVDPDTQTRIARLTSENWDSPLIVTTNVQFFESLFANRTSRCRKLHRIANSVIILDEVQTLPVEFLKPCISMLQTLVDLFNCTILFCTATQPAFSYRDDFKIGLKDVREIVPTPQKLYQQMKRVKVELLGKQTDDEVVRKIDQEESALCIVNTKKHAADLFQYLSETKELKSLFHLSTNMCAAHRKEQLGEIRERLSNQRPCTVVSTQLIEAGVDVDFPVVFRAMTGLDSIAQAAGRCNREGRLPVGTVYVFLPTEVKLRGMLKQVSQSGAEAIELFRSDPLSLDAIEQYFQLHYWQNKDGDWDKQGVMECFADMKELAFQFRTAAERFRLIEDQTKSLFVPWSRTGQKIEAQIRSQQFKEDPRFRRSVLRRIQRFIVPVYENVFRQLAGSGEIELINENLAVLVNQSMYCERTGFASTRSGHIDIQQMII